MSEITVAVYPGTFDPVTNGHLDILRRARRLFDRVICGVGINPVKTPLFTLEERLEMLRESITLEQVEVDAFAGLTVEFARKHRAKAIVRGLRPLTDIEFEFSVDLVNAQIAPEIETIFLATRQEFMYLSSGAVREAALIGKHIIPGSVTPFVERKLREKLGF
jgi:pantetheine-phosphate adenylyltransferase